MTTVIAVYNSGGCVGRCDAKCHNAMSGKPCNCICGGKNHGKGLHKAIENNHERVGLTPEDLRRFAEAHDRDAAELFVCDRINTNNRQARRDAREALRAREFSRAHGNLAF